MLSGIFLEYFPAFSAIFGIVSVIIPIVFITIAVLSIVKIVTNKKNQSKDSPVKTVSENQGSFFDNISQTISSKIQSVVSSVKSSQSVRCEYCGTEIKANEKKCSSCGANKPTIK